MSDIDVGRTGLGDRGRVIVVVCVDTVAMDSQHDEFDEEDDMPEPDWGTFEESSMCPQFNDDLNNVVRPP